MAASRTVVIAGAGIGGLTAALAIAREGISVVVLEAAGQLEEIGAGIQLSPNASRVLRELGLAHRLRELVVAPQELRVMNARSGRILARGPLGAAAEAKYGAPFWVIHRGDLQTVLREAVEARPEITLKLGRRVDDFAAHENGVTVAATSNMRSTEERGIALIAADGLWSVLRRRLGHDTPPRFARHTAWRALVPANNVDRALREPAVNLWFGRGAHLVHYPVRDSRLINVVAILRDTWREPGWSEPGEASELLRRFPAKRWQATTRELLSAADTWQKWALYDCAPLSSWGRGPVTLLGDAAHPMLPYLAQGAAMAIEDAAVIARCLAQVPDAPAQAMRAYESARLSRTARTQRAARRNGAVYHMGAAGALLRTLALRAMGGERLISSYDWLYGWTPKQ